MTRHQAGELTSQGFLCGCLFSFEVDAGLEFASLRSLLSVEISETDYNELFFLACFLTLASYPHQGP